MQQQSQVTSGVQSFGATPFAAFAAPQVGVCFLAWDGADMWISENGNPYAMLSALVAGGGWQDAGAVVRLVTLTDQVSVGVAVPPANQKLYIEYTPTTAVGSAVEATLGGEQDGATGFRGIMNRTAPLGAGDAIACYTATPEADAADVFPAFTAAFRATPPAGAAGTSTVLGFLCEGTRAGADYVATMLTIDQDVVLQSATLTAGDAFDARVVSGAAFLNGAAGDCRITCGTPENTDTLAHAGGSVFLEPSAGVGGGAHGSVIAMAATAAMVPLVIDGIAAQTGDRLQIQNASGVPTLAVDSSTNLEFRPVAAAAGSDSTRTEYAAVTSVATRTFAVYNEADVGSDTYRLVYEDGNGDRFMALDVVGGGTGQALILDTAIPCTMSIGTGAAPQAGAILEIASITMLSMPLPVMTTAEAAAIAVKPTFGMYADSTLGKLRFWNGAVFETITSA